VAKRTARGIPTVCYPAVTRDWSAEDYSCDGEVTDVFRCCAESRWSTTDRHKRSNDRRNISVFYSRVARDIIATYWSRIKKGRRYGHVSSRVSLFIIGFSLFIDIRLFAY